MFGIMTFNIKAYQGHMSGPMIKFQWLRSYKLTGYKHPQRPLVVFGCYKPEDRRLIAQHKAEVIIVWMGNDTRIMNYRLKGELRDKKITHVTWLKPAQELLRNQGVDCHLIKIPIKERPRPEPVILGSKIYAYVQAGIPEYHGSDTIKELELEHPLLIGDHSIKQADWYNGESDKFYAQAFIGLGLSKYVGGAMSILEMGVRGIKVVTNVLDLPNCIPWKTNEDIENAIKEESKKIGQSSNGLVEEVYDRLVEVKGCFNPKHLLA